LKLIILKPNKISSENKGYRHEAAQINNGLESEYMFDLRA